MSRLPRTLSVVSLVALTVNGCASHTAVSTTPAAPTGTSAPAAEPIDLPLLERRIAAHMRFLASDALNGRGSGTRDEWIAATYIGAQLAALGLEPMGEIGRASCRERVCWIV